MYFLKKLLIAFLVFQYFGCSDSKSDKQEFQNDKERLLSTLEDFNTAFQQGDVAALHSMVTENYVHTNGSSKAIGKTTWFNYLDKRATAIASGKLKVIDYKMEDIAIQFHGAIALVTGKVLVTTMEKEELTKNAYRITNIWVNENGQWKRAGFHDGKIQ